MVPSPLPCSSLQSSCTPRSPASSRSWCRVSGRQCSIVCVFVCVTVFRLLMPPRFGHALLLARGDESRVQPACRSVCALLTPYPCLLASCYRRGHLRVSTAPLRTSVSLRPRPFARPHLPRNPTLLFPALPSLSSLIYAAPLSLLCCTCNAAAHHCAQTLKIRITSCCSLGK